MRFCIIVGSSRSDGISNVVCELIKRHVSGRASLDFIHLREHRIEICDADNACEHIACGIKDDMSAIVERMKAADALIYMPVMHAYGVNSRFQAFLERSGYGYLRPQNRPLENKLAGVIVVGRRYGHTTVFGQIVLNLLLNKTILVGSGFPATFMGIMGGAADTEASQALHEMIDRMLEIAERLTGSLHDSHAQASGRAAASPVTVGSCGPAHHLCRDRDGAACDAAVAADAIRRRQDRDAGANLNL